MTRLHILLYIILSIILSSFVAADLNTKLANVYNFEETSGHLTDKVGNLDSTEESIFSRTATGINNNAWDFELSNANYAIVNLSLTNNKDNITINCWFKPESVPGARMEIFSSGTAGGFTALRTEADTELDAVAYTGAEQSATTGIVIANSWQMMTLIYNSTRLTVYLNGTERGIGVAASNPMQSTGARFGSLGTAANFHFDGLIDECYFWNRSMNSSDVAELWNGGTGTFYPFPVAASVTSPSFVAPTPAEGANNNTNVIINATHTGTDITWYGYVNNVSVFSDKSSPTSHYNYTTNFIAQGNYEIKFGVKNSTSGLFSNNITRNIVYDSVSPSITIGSNSGFSTNNQTIINSYTSNLTLDISFYDENLFEAIINITNSTGNSIFSIINTSMTDTTANYTNIIDINGMTPQNLTVKLAAGDSHTKNKIKDYNVKKGLLDNYIEYKTEEGITIRIETLEGLLGIDSAATVKQKDRYTFKWKFKDKKTTTTFRVTSDYPLIYVDKEYNAHFVTKKGLEGNWIDFNSIGLTKSNYEVTKITDYIYEVTIKNVDQKEFNFESIGGLNIVEQHYKVQIGAVYDIWVWDSVTTQGVNTTVTIGSQTNNTLANLTPATLSNITYDQILLVLNASGYYLTEKAINPLLGSYQNISYNITPSDALEFTFRNEESKLLITGNEVSLDVFSSVFSNNYSTTTGIQYVTGLGYDTYTVRYTADGFYERFYFLTFQNGTEYNITLYLVNSTNADVITATVYDQSNSLLEDVYIQSLKYDVATNDYSLVEMSKTNFEGETKLHLIQNTEYYKFFLYYPLSTLRQATTPTYIYDTSIVFQINTGEDIAEDYSTTGDIVHSLTFNPTTHIFSFTFSDSSSSISRGCMDVHKVLAAGFNETIDSSCVDGVSGVINTDISAIYINDTTYVANAYATLNGIDWFLDGLSYTYPSNDNNPSSMMGLFIIFIITLLFAFALKVSIELGIIIIPLPLLFGSLMGIIDIAVPITVGLEIGAIILAMILNKVID